MIRDNLIPKFQAHEPDDKRNSPASFGDVVVRVVRVPVPEIDTREKASRESDGVKNHEH